MKRILTLALAAGMLFGAATGARAIDFKASGEWLVGFGAGDGSLLESTRDVGQKRSRADSDDIFNAGQRFRLQLDAVASESLSGTVFFEIGDQFWGRSGEGASLGADGTNVIKVKNAYLDWLVPNTDLRLRMGLQAIAMPNVAGGSAIMDGDAAAVVASYQFNENVGLTALWMRPLNDNYTGVNADGQAYGNGYSNYLDNMDLFALMLPLNFDGVSLTPWAMLGFQGKNARFNEGGVETADGVLGYTLPGYYPEFDGLALGETSKAYGTMFWAGLPIALTLWDPLNIELDINYGYVEAMGRYDVYKRGVDLRRGSTQRQGWLVKALVEYLRLVRLRRRRQREERLRTPALHRRRGQLHLLHRRRQPGLGHAQQRRLRHEPHLRRHLGHRPATRRHELHGRPQAHLPRGLLGRHQQPVHGQVHELLLRLEQRRLQSGRPLPHHQRRPAGIQPRQQLPDLREPGSQP